MQLCYAVTSAVLTIPSDECLYSTVNCECLYSTVFVPVYCELSWLYSYTASSGNRVMVLDGYLDEEDVTKLRLFMLHRALYRYDEKNLMWTLRKLPTLSW